MKIDIQIEEVSTVERRVQFSVDAKDVDKVLNSIFRQLSRNVRLKGFRPGKIPRKVFEQLPQYRQAIQEEAQKQLLESSFDELLKDDRLEVLNIPTADNGEVKSGKNYDFTATVEVRPHVDLSSLSETTVKVEEISFSDEDVEKEIEKKRDEMSSLRDLDDRGAQEGDLVKVDYNFTQGEDVRNREGVQIWIGRGLFPKEVEDALVGCKAEDEKDVEVPPEEGQEHPQKFHLKINSVQEKVMPELDDEMAKDAGFEDLADMRAKTLEQLKEDAKERCETRAKTRLLEQLADTLDVPVPENFLSNHIDSKVRETLMQFRMFAQNNQFALDPDLLRHTVRNDAYKEVRHGIILQQVIQDFEVEAEESEVDEELAQVAKSQNRSVAYLKSAYSEEDLQNLKREIQNRKAIDLVFEKVAQEVETLSADALQERIKEEREAAAAAREAASEQQTGEGEGSEDTSAEESSSES